MKSTIILIAALTAIGLTAQPSLAQRRVSISTLNAQLQEAVCAQNWQRAIQIVERMKRLRPEYNAALTTYQGQLAAWLRSGAEIPNWSASCRANIITLSTESTAGSTATPTPTGNAAPIRGMWIKL